jgi:Flp pilus assembly pilin Flp
MLINVRDMKKQKGQGIVEYALLLAFILAIAIAMQGSGIDNAIANTFSRVAQALGFETDQDKWSTMNADDLLNDSASAAARLKHDKDFLANIGKKFIGLTSSELQSKYNINSII